MRLGGRERARPQQLSGGQQQRVALARAVVNRPDVLLLDEPLGALDLKLRAELQMQLKDLHRAVGITFCYVTHDQGEAFTMSDRVAVMNGGLLEQVGAPEEVYRRPRTAFVADFVGASNRLAGRVVRVEGGGRYVAHLEGVGERSVPGPDGIERDAAVVVVVRPEKLEIADGPAAGASLVATVSDVSFLGSQHLVRLRSDALGDLVATTNSGAAAPPALGTQVRVSWPDEGSWAVPLAAAEGAEPIGPA